MSTTPYEEAIRGLGPGQPVTLEPGSPIYRGPYTSKVLGITDEGVQVGVPMDAGKLVLLPVGTRVKVGAKLGDQVRTIDMEIVMRTGGKNRALFLSPASPEPPKKVEAPSKPATLPAIAVSSGKGGVGKTTFVVNLSLALSRLGRRVCVIDGDLGTANVDVLLNLSAPYNLAHVIHGEKHMLEVVVEGPEGLIVLPGGSGFQDLTTLSQEKFDVLLSQFHELEKFADILLIDTGSGLSPSVTNFLMAATESILITTPEPHAITDCYALIKVLASHEYKQRLRLVVNRSENEAEGNLVARKMAFASKKFLNTELGMLGYILDDPAVSRSVRKQSPLILEEPRARSVNQFIGIAERLIGLGDSAAVKGEGRSFLERMRRLIPLGRTHS